MRRSSMAVDLSIATYNVFMRPEGIIFNDGQKKRLPLMLPRIVDLGADILILNEAFDDSLRKKIVEGLAPVYPHRTKVVGRDRGLRQDGGVLILSKWEIAVEKEMTFGISEGSDRWGDKGCMYAKVNGPDGCVHVFGTHLDSGKDGKTARRKQIEKIRDFVVDVQIPLDEPVFVGGDFNMGPHHRLDEITDMKTILKATLPTRTGHTHSYDPTSNILADGVTKHLDHVVFLHGYDCPTNHENEVIQLKAAVEWDDRKHKKNKDLSDHYPVVARFRWV